MSRQPLWRRVDFLPNITSFKPAGVPLAQLQEIRISIEEVEAVRLKDLEGLEQEECAGKMNVSRSTFARILLSARQKMADALINGKAIRIEGGNYELTKRSFRCGNGHEWDVPFEVMIKKPPELCPTCNTANIMTLWPWRSGPGVAGMGRQFRGGRNYRRGGD
ncbi:MAG TPA: DUF134 domain-containing protein [Dehalococcoidia bacterium]|nr:DUF134 domain-containing protein [Dehalococcoidia bacterium]